MPSQRGLDIMCGADFGAVRTHRESSHQYRTGKLTMTAMTRGTRRLLRRERPCGPAPLGDPSPQTPRPTGHNGTYATG